LDPTLSGLASGFYNLELKVSKKSDLIILAGRPSMGKTALGLNIALNTIQDSSCSIF
jgi:replicative DNA helicase